MILDSHFEADFKVRCKVIKERMLEKEKEIKGRWCTKEKMDKSSEYSKWPAGTQWEKT